MKKYLARANKYRHSNGFTLVEMAIVLLIVALLLGGLLPTLSSQVEQRRRTETNKQLDEIKEALIGYTIANGRLPCPASAASNGMESFDTAASGNASNGKCSTFYSDSYVPAATLGLASSVDSLGNKGFAVDSWGNRIRYAVTSWDSTTPVFSKVFTTTNGMATVGISNLQPDILVCTSAGAASFSGTSCGTVASNNSLTSAPGVPFVIFSTGPNGANGGGTDEAANLDNNDTFISHLPAPSSAAGGKFDHMVVWLSPNVLINRMVAAGKLP